MVSPAEKDGASITPLGFGIFGPIGGLVQSSEDGSAVTYVADAPVESEPEGNRAIEGTQVISNRGSEAWASKDIVTPHNKGEGLRAGTAQEYREFSMDLSLGVVQPFGEENPLMEPPLVPGVSSEERGVYRRHNTTCQSTPATCYEPIVTAANDTAGTPFGGKLEYKSASPDLLHIVLRAPIKLTTGAPEAGGLYEWNAEAPAAEQLKYISLLPAAPGKKGKEAPEAQLGDDTENERQNSRNAISSDGRRIVWVNNVEGLQRARLYMRDTQLETTILVNPVEGTKPPSTKTEVVYQTASSDGKRIFFTDTAKLTPDSKLKPKEGFRPADLYVCEVEEKEPGKPECKVTDLTASFAGPGEVAGAIMGASADGTTVYFVANGAAEEKDRGKCTIPGDNEVKPPSVTCNLYSAHFNGTGWDLPTRIAVLSEEDNPSWGGGKDAGHFLWKLTSRVSPNGRYLAFMSNTPLTGYDNRDANPAAKEARDQEVFLYDANGATIACVSCNPNPEQRPTGVFDQKFAGEGQNLRVDPSAVWEGQWLAGSIPGWTPLSPQEAPYQGRYLLDNGRVFFNSADPLVGEDTNKRLETIEGTATEVGVMDVYQYQPAGVGTCAGPSACVALLSSGSSPEESAFMDASVSGNDAFIFTSQKLVRTDPDGNYDVYDARVCTESSPCIKPPPPPPPPCNGEGTCRGEGATPPGFGPPTSSVFSGPGNTGKTEVLTNKVVKKPILTRQQKLARALSACRKNYKHSKPKRVACERRARKAFGPHKSSGGKKK